MGENRAAMRKLRKPAASQVAGESQPSRLAKSHFDTVVPRGQPEIARGLESQIELWLPLKQHKSAVNCGIRPAVARNRLIDKDRRLPRFQLLPRGAGCQETSSTAGSRGYFSLDIPFHRTTWLNLPSRVSKQVLQLLNGVFGR